MLLVDRTLHMLTGPAQLEVFARLLASAVDGGVVLLADEPSNIPGLRAVLESDRRPWRIFFERRGYLFSRQAG